MNLQQLYYFQAISRLKNYTKAAEQLLVAQSSLSHSISDLERELGVPLFFKVGRNIDITEYGKQFLIHVDRITAELELANQELKNMLNPNMGKIRIALAYTVSNRFIPNMIKGFYENEDNRAIQFEFSEKQAAKIIDAFANRTLDLGFGARMDSDQLEYFHIFDEEIVAVVSSRHPLALRGSVKLQDLIREPMVSYTYNCGTRYWIDDVFRRFQLTPNIIQEVDTEKVMASAVASGLGVALMPRMTELSIYDVVPLTLENSELHRPMFMCWPKGETLRPVVKNFRDYYGPGGRASLLNRSHSTGARWPAYIEKQKDAARGEWAASFCKRRGNRSQRIRHSEICGKITIRTRPMANSMVKGSETFAIRITGILVMELATNRLIPTGGVTKPTARFTTIMMPKWTRSTPMAVMTGARIGVRIRMAGAASITMPTKSRKMLTTSRIVHLLEKEDVIQAPTICGTFIRASTRPKETAAESTKRMGAIVFRDSIKTAGISETLMVL